MTNIERITQRVNRSGDVNDMSTPRPMLTLNEFFDGNNVLGSIGTNLVPTPPPSEFFERFKAIRARSDVGDVRVQVSLFDTPEWPYSNTVWILTSAMPEDVLTWFDESMRPDECGVGWPKDYMLEPVETPEGMQPVFCFWD